MPKAINFASIKQELKKIVSEVSEIPVEKIGEETKFVEDLNIDSMMALEIVAKIEKRYKVAVPEEEIPKVRSLKNIYGLMENLLKK